MLFVVKKRFLRISYALLIESNSTPKGRFPSCCQPMGTALLHRSLGYTKKLVVNKASKIIIPKHAIEIPSDKEPVIER